MVECNNFCLDVSDPSMQTVFITHSSYFKTSMAVHKGTIKDQAEKEILISNHQILAFLRQILVNSLKFYLREALGNRTLVRG